MTQYKDKVAKRKVELEEEAKSKQTVGIDTRYKDGRPVDHMLVGLRLIPE